MSSSTFCFFSICGINLSYWATTTNKNEQNLSFVFLSFIVGVSDVIPDHLTHLNDLLFQYPREQAVNPGRRFFWVCDILCHWWTAASWLWILHVRSESLESLMLDGN